MSREIDKWCRRRFYKPASAEVRYYTPTSSCKVAPDDIANTTNLTVETDENGDRTWERTWAATDYDLTPYNAALDGMPYTKLRVAPLGRYQFPLRAKSVKVTAFFGFDAVPDAVHEACLLQSARIFKRKDTPFGTTTGGSELGVLRLLAKLDPDVELLLSGYRKLLVG